MSAVRPGTNQILELIRDPVLKEVSTLIAFPVHRSDHDGAISLRSSSLLPVVRQVIFK